jgi:hypothetical protein
MGPIKQDRKKYLEMLGIESLFGKIQSDAEVG